MATQGMVTEADMSDQDMVDPVPLVVNHMLPEAKVGDADLSHGDMEPPTKRTRRDSDLELSMDMSVKKLLFNVNTAICLRLEAIETKLDQLCSRTQTLEERLDQLYEQQQDTSDLDTSNPESTLKKSITYLPPFPKPKGGLVVGVPAEKQGSFAYGDIGGKIGPNITLITLNSEEDFPNGSWLGDDSNPEMRVRVPVTPSDLLHIHSNCRTAEKMALTLLDYLFDRETQASSNLSGLSKHGKKQLDPLMIYGIRCHLIHKFGITEQDWHRIKQNMDSKCRTAFRRKNRGLPLTVKAFRGKAPPTYVQKIAGAASGGLGLLSGQDLGNHSDNSLSDSSELQIQQGDADIPQGLMQAQSDGGPLSGLGEIQVLHATPEQIAQLHQGHQIQILQGENNTHIIQLSSSSGSTSLPVGSIQNLSGPASSIPNVQVTEIPISLATSGPNGISVTPGDVDEVPVKSDDPLHADVLVQDVSQ